MNMFTARDRSGLDKFLHYVDSMYSYLTRSDRVILPVAVASPHILLCQSCHSDADLSAVGVAQVVNGKSGALSKGGSGGNADADVLEAVVLLWELGVDERSLVEGLWCVGVSDDGELTASVGLVANDGDGAA